ncbi:DUF1330 domain-containing protein [Rhodobacteraceae bacterium NNCM2]|nr:DUF1330 domain-containing protein [Coraliihabitans acroporae]
MKCYAIGLLTNVTMGAGIRRYLEEIDATLAPFGGCFVIHGGKRRVLEGNLPGDLIVIAFPSRERAQGWYASPAYQSILPYRAENADGAICLIDGVDEGHRATDILAPAGED